MKLSDAGLALLKRFEGCRLDAYLDERGVPTIGYGHTVDVRLGLHVTQHQADEILLSDLDFYVERLEALTAGVALTQNQFDALVCLVFNIGQFAFANSTLRKLLNRFDFAGAAEEFTKWCHAGRNPDGSLRVSEGLTARRAAERALFLTP